MPIPTDFYPMSMKIFIFSAFDKNDRSNIAVVISTVIQMALRLKWMNVLLTLSVLISQYFLYFLCERKSRIGRFELGSVG